MNVLLLDLMHIRPQEIESYCSKIVEVLSLFRKLHFQELF